MGEQGVTRGVPMGEARARLAELVDRTRRTREPVHLTRNGAPVAVLVDAGEWALLAELAERYEELTAALAARDAELADAMAQLAALRHEPPAAAAGAGVLATTPLQSSSAARELLTVLLTWVLAVATATARDPGGLLAGL